MSTDTTDRTSGQPSVTAASLKHKRDRIARITAMANKLLEEIHTLDSGGLGRLRAIDAATIRDVLPDLSCELRHELTRLAMPLTGGAELSDAELRIAHAQLVGWLNGLLRTAQTGSFRADAPRAVAATATKAGHSVSSGIPASPDSCSQPAFGSDSAVNNNRIIDINLRQSPVVTARRTLITAIAKRITQKRLTAAQAATALDLTGPQVSALLNEDIEHFALDELVNLLAPLELTIQVVAKPQR